LHDAEKLTESEVPPWPTDMQGVVFKHILTNASDIKQRYEKELGDVSKTTLLVMVRDPLSQMVSWTHAGYFLEPCFGRDVTLWNTQCIADNENVGGKNAFPDSSSHVFKSSMQVYNDYIRQYMDLKDHGGFRNVVVVPYEDLVLTPNNVVSNIADKLNVRVPEGGATILQNSAKGEGIAHGREAVLKKITQRSYLKEIPSDMMPIVCKAIDKKQIASLTEGTYTEHPRSYMDSC